MRGLKGQDKIAQAEGRQRRPHAWEIDEPGSRQRSDRFAYAPQGFALGYQPEPGAAASSSGWGDLSLLFGGGLPTISTIHRGSASFARATNVESVSGGKRRKEPG